MAKFLFSMLAVNGLGLLTRVVPVARVLADRGHNVAVFNPSPAPTKLIDDEGLIGLLIPSRSLPPPLWASAQIVSNRFAFKA
jgi:hypothetical protein